MPVTQPRKLESQVVHVIRRRVSFSDNATAGVEIGVIPAGSHVTVTNVSVETAFNGTSSAVSVGTSSNVNAFAAGGSVSAASAGYRPTLTGTGCGNVTADTTVLAFVTGTGATAGLADIVVQFYPHPL